MSVPRKRIGAAGRRRAAARAPRISVVLPQPDSPTMPSVSPSCSVNETSSTACTLPDLGPVDDARRCRDRESGSEGARPRAARRRRRSALSVRHRSPARRREADLAADHAQLAPSPPASSQQRSRCSRASGSCAASGGTSVHLCEGVRAARAEVAARRRVQQRRRRARDRRQASRAIAVDPRDRAEQAPRVGVLRVVEELVERALLDDPAGVHDDDAVGDVGDDAEVVGDEDDPVPASRSRSARSSSRICAWIVTSSAVVGSSAISSFGEHDSAIAIITRWRMPPENSCG